MIEDGIDPKTAGTFAAPAGYVIGAIELLQIEKLIPGFGKKGISELVKQLAKKKVTGNLGKTLLKTSGRLAKNLAATTAIETTQELSQEIISITAEVGAGIYEDMATKEGYLGPDTEEVKKRLTETLTSSLLGFPLLGLPGSIHSTMSLHGRDKFVERVQTKRAEEALTTELSDQVEQASTFDNFKDFHESLPEIFDDKEANKLFAACLARVLPPSL